MVKKVVLIILFFIVFSCRNNDYNNDTYEHDKEAVSYFKQARLLVKSQKITEAVKFYDRAIEEDSTFIEAYFKRGELKFYSNDLNGAKLDMEKIMNFNVERNDYDYHIMKENSRKYLLTIKKVETLDSSELKKNGWPNVIWETDGDTVIERKNRKCFQK